MLMLMKSKKKYFKMATLNFLLKNIKMKMTPIKILLELFVKENEINCKLNEIICK
jgi:hypothetical protein